MVVTPSGELVYTWQCDSFLSFYADSQRDNVKIFALIGIKENINFTYKNRVQFRLFNELLVFLVYLL